MAVLRVLLFAAFMVTAALAKPVNLSEAEDQSSESTEENSSEEDSNPVGRSHHGTLQPANTPDIIVMTEPSEEPANTPDIIVMTEPLEEPANTPDIIVMTEPLEEPANTPDIIVMTEPLEEPANTPDIIVMTEPQGTAHMLPSVEATISPNDISVLPDHIDPQTSTDSVTIQPLPADPSQTAPGTDIFQDKPVTDPAHDSIIGNVLPVSEVTLDAGLTETHDGTNQPQATTTYQEPPLGTTDPTLSVPMATAETTVPVCITFQFATSQSDLPRGDSMRRK